MPASNVPWPTPLTRANPWYPGQFGVPGAWTDTGLRQHCTGTIFYVDPNFPGASDQRDGTDPTAPLLTIQAAVNRCEDHTGDVIVVMQTGAWQYDARTARTAFISEEVTLNKAGVRLVGLSPGPPGILWTPASNGGVCLTVTALDCLVEGFLFYEGAYTGCVGIEAIWDGTTAWADNVVIRHCMFEASCSIGVQLDYVWYALVEGNWFIGSNYGIYYDPADSPIAYCEFRDNWFQDCPLGAIVVTKAQDCKIHHNNIYNEDAATAAAATDLGITTAGVIGGNIVDHNVLSCLLPVPAAGDYNDFCTAATSDAWVENYCMNGPTTTNPT